MYALDEHNKALATNSKHRQKKHTERFLNWCWSLANLFETSVTQSEMVKSVLAAKEKAGVEPISRDSEDWRAWFGRVHFLVVESAK